MTAYLKPKTVEWLTPLWVIRSLGSFDLDPCAPVTRPWSTAKKHYTVKQDGLSKQWKGRVWLNPPYGREIKKWTDKFSDSSEGIALVFARTDSAWFHRLFLKCYGLLIVKGRISFCYPSGIDSNKKIAASVFFAKSKKDWKRLMNAGIPGVLLKNREAINV